MKGDPKVIDILNDALRHELTAVSQYWLHYRLQEDWGLGKMAKKSREESIEEMEHADKLIDRIIFAADRAELAAACRALDRVLLWNYYMIPQLYTPFERIAWWDRFGHPDPLPPRDPGFPSVWWWDEEKAAAVEAAR